MPNRNARFVYALNWANEMHWDDRRKHTVIPYFSHCMSVAALVMEAGGDEDEVIAGLLHDVIEDCDTVEHIDIKRRFDKRVTDIVRGLSDCEPKKGEKKPPWRDRKEAYLKRLKRTRNKSILLVSNADKLHNARSILTDGTDKLTNILHEKWNFMTFLV